MAKNWGKEDNSSTAEKAALRIKNITEDAHVLDLFCGTGKMYQGAYKNRAAKYYGVDKEKIHSKELCTLSDNIQFVLSNNILEYNVFDLDDYGTPWKLLYLIMQKTTQPELTFFITDGLVMHQKVDGTVTKFVSATEKLPKKFNIPGLNRWYEDIFLTMLLDIEKRYDYHVTKAECFHNQRRSVYYWCVKLEKTETKEVNVHSDAGQPETKNNKNNPVMSTKTARKPKKSTNTAM